MKRTVLICLIIIVAGLVVYWPSRSYDFVYLDEENLIIKRQDYLKNTVNISDAFMHNVSYPSANASFYRPMLTVSFMADATRDNAVQDDINPGPYHTTNIVLHIIAVLTVFVLVMELSFSRLWAGAFALVFMVHPLLIQAVAWIPGRNDSLLAIFALASVYFFLRSSRPGASRWWVVSHVVAFVFALFTKEVAIVTPLVCILLWWVYREQRRSWHWWLLGIGWAVILTTWFLFRHAALAAVQPPPFDISLFIRTAVPATILYIGKMLIPIKLSVMPFLPDTSLWMSIFSTIILAAGIIFGVDRANRRLAIAGLLWILLWLGPALISVESENRTVFFEHRAYLPLFGFLLIFFIIFRRFLARFKPAVAGSILAAVILTLGGITYAREPVFKNGETFWRSAIASAPNLSRTHDGLAVILSRGGKYEEALVEHMRAIELGPEDKRLHNNLAATYGRMGRLADAEKALLQEIAINPRFAGAYKNLIELYTAEGKKQKANAVLKRAQELGLSIEEINKPNSE